MIPDALLSEAKGEVASLDVSLAYRVTKAFAAYFELTNLAETNHRKRRRRAAELHTDEPPLPGSFRGTLLRMKTGGRHAGAGAGRAGEIEVQPVFTAHPTEITRRAVLLKRRRIAARAGETRSASAAGCRRRKLAKTRFWATSRRCGRPMKCGCRSLTVVDEIRTGLSYYVMTVFDAVPKIYEGIAADFREVYGAELDMVSLPVCVRFGSWIGGDRDGNPFVTPECTRAGAGAGAGDGAVALHAGGGAAGAAADGFVAPDAGIGGVARASRTI